MPWATILSFQKLHGEKTTCSIIKMVAPWFFGWNRLLNNKKNKPEPTRHDENAIIEDWFNDTYFPLKFYPYIFYKIFLWCTNVFYGPRKYKIKLFEINFLIRVKFFCAKIYIFYHRTLFTTKKMLFNSSHKNYKQFVLPSSILIIVLHGC